ncbi:MAG: cytochrome c3 family protein [Bacillota bacterium]
MKNKRILVIFFLVFLFLLFPLGCRQQETPKEDNKVEEPQGQEQATYVGADKCYGCHADFKDMVANTAHVKGFQPLESYNVQPDSKITIYEDVKEGEPKSYNLSDAKIAGVMANEYVVGSIEGKYYRLASVKEEGGKWKLEPASVADVNKDGTEEWVFKSYTCGDCHSPGLEADPERKMNLEAGFSCESCHGPGSVHVTTRAKEAISNGQESCLNCHTASQPKEEGDILIAQNHYGTRSWFDSNHNTGKPEDCLNCHTSHKINADGKLLKEDSAESLCSKCHQEGVDVEKLMWVNPTDERGHFTKDHSFGKYLYEKYDDDPATQPVEIRNPETVKQMKEKMKK